MIATVIIPAPTTTALTKPSRREIKTRMFLLGMSQREINRLWAMFEELAAKVDPSTGTAPHIWVDEETHSALDEIMPDMAVALPGSLHAAINAHNLPDGSGYLHDKHGNCSLEVINYRTR